MATKGSAAGFATNRPDHLLPEGRRWPLKGQQQVLQQTDQITHILREGDGHQRVSSRFCSKQTRWLTLWGQEMATKGSAAGFAANRPHHLLPDGRRKGQQQVLQQTDQITHSLRAGDGHQRVSSMFCSKQTRSLTNWAQEMATKGSAAGFAANRPDHLQTGDRRWPPKGQQQVLQQTDQITYSLRAGDGHQIISSKFCSKRPDHLLPEGRRWPPKGQQQVLQQTDQITYCLRVGDGDQRVSSRFCSKQTRSLTN